MSLREKVPRHARFVFGLALATAALVVPGTAQASFHEIKVREVFLGTAANSRADAYVELQSYAAGQNLLGNHTLRVFNQTGATAGACTFPPSYQAANAASQATVLIGQTFNGRAVDCAGNLGITPAVAAAGAVCWAVDQPTPSDCMSWGGFSGTEGSPTGTPAPVPPDGMALQRSIAAGCPTLLEASDDTDNSAADFFAVTPNPRTNASPITETPCGGGGGGGGGGGDKTPPQTKIKKVTVSGSTATVKFSGTDSGRIARASGLRFKCRFDKGKFKKCSSPKKYKHLKAGKHKVQVEAIDAAGNVDPSPAKKKFTV